MESSTPTKSKTQMDKRWYNPLCYNNGFLLTGQVLAGLSIIELLSSFQSLLKEKEEV